MWEIELDENGLTESPFLNEFLRKGYLRGQRRSLLRPLKVKFAGAVTKVVEDTLNETSDSDTFDQLLDAAIDAKTIDEFEEVLYSD